MVVASGQIGVPGEIQWQVNRSCVVTQLNGDHSCWFLTTRRQALCNVLDCIGLYQQEASSTLLSGSLSHYVHIYQLTTGELVSANQLKSGELDTQTDGKKFQISSLFLVVGVGFLLSS